MNIRNHFPTEELQKRDAAHHLHPFTAQHDLANKGSRIITSAQGVYVYDSNGEQLLDAMAGLWCGNIGYGREELAQAAERQMRELPYYRLCHTYLTTLLLYEHYLYHAHKESNQHLSLILDNNLAVWRHNSLQTQTGVASLNIS